MTLREPKSLVAQLGDAHREIERLRAALRSVDSLLVIMDHDNMLAEDARDIVRQATGDEQVTDQKKLAADFVRAWDESERGV